MNECKNNSKKKLKSLRKDPEPFLCILQTKPTFSVNTWLTVNVSHSGLLYWQRRLPSAKYRGANNCDTWLYIVIFKIMNKEMVKCFMDNAATMFPRNWPLLTSCSGVCGGNSTTVAVSGLLRCLEAIKQSGVTRKTIHRLCIFIHFPFGECAVTWEVNALSVFKFMSFYICQ